MLKLVEIISYLLFFFCFFKVIKLTIKRFREGYFTVAMPLVVTMVIFLLIPIMLDLLIGKPDFSRYRGFYNASLDVKSDIYYNFYISLTMIFVYRYIKNGSFNSISITSSFFLNQAYRLRYLLWFVMLLPLFAVLASHDPLEYLNYKALLNNRTLAFKKTHATVFKATLFSAAAGSLLFYLLKFRNNSRLVFPKYFAFFILIFFAFWVDGKRGIIVKFIFLTLASGWLLGILKPKKIIQRSFLLLGVLIVFISSYGKDFDTSSTLSRGVYESLRLNLGRDHTIKYTLYKEYVLDEQVLSYRGQSFFFDLVFFIPRSLWSGKPYPYAVYYVTSVLNLEPEPIGWSFTTCILEEMISNFGFLGVFLGPIFLLWICKKGDKSENILFKLLAVLLSVFFMFTQLSAFMTVFLAFIFILIKGVIKRNRFKI